MKEGENMAKIIVFVIIVAFACGLETAGKLFNSVAIGAVAIAEWLNQILLTLTGEGLLPKVLGGILATIVLGYILGKRNTLLNKLFSPIVEKTINQVLRIVNNWVFNNKLR